MSNSEFIWQGRVDSEDGEQGLRWHQKISATTDSADIALLGFCCDLGVANNKGRTGAKDGPDAIRTALANLAWHGGKGTIYDAGNIVAQADLPTAQQVYAERLAALLQQHPRVIALGGGHEIGWASYLGLARHHTQQRIGIINIDAHFDLRKPAPLTSSGTPFRQVAEHCAQQNKTFYYACLGVSESANTPALFDYAQQQNCRYLLDDACQLAAAQQLLTPMLKAVDQLYVTICLDAFPAAIAPGVSAPSALGVQPQFAIELLRWLGQSQQTLGYCWQLADIAEMNPRFDQDNRTAKLAARLVYEIANCA